VVTQLVIAKGQHKMASTDDNEFDDDVQLLNSFVVFDDPRGFGDKPQEQTQKKETRQQKKERQERRRNLKDYGIIHCHKLQWEIEGNMLCKCCVAEMLHGPQPVNVDIKELGVTVRSKTSSFACILTVECWRKMHSYTIELTRREIPDENTHVPGAKKRGRPVGTCCIHDYDINYQAYQLMQVLGNGITSLDTIIGMLGLGVHAGSHREWTYIGNELGKAQQKKQTKYNLVTYKLK